MVESCQQENESVVECADGSKGWYRNGKLHRENGPALIWANGDQSWYIDGVQHRADGPAYVSACGRHKAWFFNGKFHRENGPAIERNNSWTTCNKDWYLNGKKLTLAAFSKKSKMTPEERSMFLLKWSD